MGLISGVVSFLTGGGASSIADGVKTVHDSVRVNRTERMHREFDSESAALQQYASEFMNPPTGWFDSFVNSLNRLVRPVFAFSSFASIFYCIVAPQQYAEIMVALELTPAYMWGLHATIIGFYFGSRHLEKRMDKKISGEQRKEILETLAEMKKSRLDHSEEMEAIQVERQVEAQIDAPPEPKINRIEHPKPLAAINTGADFTPDGKGNDAIEEWLSTRV